MTLWERFRFEERICEILRGVNYHRPGHPFKRPFLTAYQIAIEYALRHEDDFHRIGKQIGGEGIGQRNSLAQYIAGQLSQRMKSGKMRDFEGAFISNNNQFQLVFKHKRRRIKSSLTASQYDLSIFRLR